MRPYETVTLNAGDASTDLTSLAVNMGQLYGMAIQCVVTGASAKGTLTVQASCDPSDNAPSMSVGGGVSNWSTYETAVVTGAQTIIFNLNDVFFKWARVLFTHDSGSSGSITINVYGKGI